MSAIQFYSWFVNYQQQAFSNNERRLVVLGGGDEWAAKLLQPILVAQNTVSPNYSIFTYGKNDFISANILQKRYREKLGSESDVVIFSVHSTDVDFNVDAFAALSGTLVAGGVFFLIMPAIRQQSSALRLSLFLQRFMKKIANYSEFVFFDEDDFCDKSLEHNPAEKGNANNNFNDVVVDNISNKYLDFGCVTTEQVQAVEAIEKVFSGHRKRPLVLTADRGRGKSSALAIACANLIEINAFKKANTPPLHIFISAPDFQSLSVFFRQIKQSLPTAQVSKGKVDHHGGCIEFIPIDVLIKTRPRANLLLIDEAAAIPVYLLAQLLNHYHRMVFASTVHGYEGAGRGFTLKFQKILAKQCPQWQALHIQQPIRWRENDPLERFVFDSCLLNAPLVDLNDNKVQMDNLSSKNISSSELLQNEGLLSQVFSLLVTAHYQTSANDLKMLLDNTNVHLLCVFSQGTTVEKNTIVSVSLLLREGKSADKVVASADILAVKNSEKRLRNQLIPQSLFSHCGIAAAFDFSYFRVLRIAVHPQLQQQGIGSYFIERISQYCVEQGADFVGSSFGANVELLSFWLKANFHLARLGFSQDKASGEYSALVLKPLSVQATSLQQQLTELFYRSFDHLLVDEYQRLNASLVQLVLRYCPEKMLAMLTEYDKETVKAFAQGERQYSNCVFSLYLWLKYQLVNNKSSTDEELLLLIERIMQKHSVKVVCEKYQLTGKKALNDYVQAVINKKGSNTCP